MKFLRNLIKGASLTTALFVFQACYGTPDWLHEADASFRVVSATDGKPIKDVGIYTRVYHSENLDWNLRGYTNDSGMASIMVGIMDGQSPEFRFQTDDGSFIAKDTVITDLHNGVIQVRLQEKDWMNAPL